MTDRSRDLDDIRVNRRGVARPKAPRRVRLARRPTIEALEGRALLSTAGSPDFTYASTSGGGVPSLATITFPPPAGTNNDGSLISGEAMQSDGKVVVVGNQLTNNPIGMYAEVSRLNTDGTIDATFGTNGFVVLPAKGFGVAATAVAIQSDGQIVVASYGTPNANREIELDRLNTDGSLDTTFGTGGSVTFSFNQGATALSFTPSELAIQPDGAIVVGGSAADLGR